MLGIGTIYSSSCSFLVASFGSLTTNGSVFTVDVTSDDDETYELCSKLLVIVLDLFLFFSLCCRTHSRTFWRLSSAFLCCFSSIGTLYALTLSLYFLRYASPSYNFFLSIYAFWISAFDLPISENKGNNKITELRTIFQRESQNS